MTLLAAATAQVVTPDWLELPSADSISREYPSKARVAGVEGRAIVRCKVAEGGELEACVSEFEEPRSSGFGEAAVRLSPEYRVDMSKSRSVEIGTSVRYTTGFSLWPGRPSHLDATYVEYPRWQTTPSWRDYLASYPSRAKRENIAGRAIADCQVTATGALKPCEISSEEPQGYGFGRAVAGLSAGYRLEIRARNDTPIAPGSRVQVAVSFQPAMKQFDEVHASHPKLPNGYALLNCRINAQAHLDRCNILRLNPDTEALRLTALQLSTKFATTLGSDGKPPRANDRVLLPIRFETAATAPVDTASSPKSGGDLPPNK